MTQENLKEMRERMQHLQRFLNIDDKLAKLENDRALTLSPGFWDDNARATAILKEIKIKCIVKWDLKIKIQTWMIFLLLS